MCIESVTSVTRTCKYRISEGNKQKRDKEQKHLLSTLRKEKDNREIRLRHDLARLWTFIILRQQEDDTERSVNRRIDKYAKKMQRN